MRLMERGFLPDSAVRRGIRRLCGRRLETEPANVEDIASEMDRGPIAPVPEAANDQHYELPPEVFEKVPGSHLKYSSGFSPGDR